MALLSEEETVVHSGATSESEMAMQLGKMSEVEMAKLSDATSEVETAAHSVAVLARELAARSAVASVLVTGAVMASRDNSHNRQSRTRRRTCRTVVMADMTLRTNRIAEPTLRRTRCRRARCTESRSQSKSPRPHRTISKRTWAPTSIPEAWPHAREWRYACEGRLDMIQGKVR